MKRLINIILFVLVLVVTNVTPVFATDHEGDAVYRNGVVQIPGYGELSWHAAISHSSDLGGIVIHAPGNNVVRYDTWSTFLGGNTFQSPGQYKYGMTAYDSSNVVNMARLLANKQNITYTTIDMLHFTSRGLYYVWDSDVTQLRCDGLVEYCYEWYNFPILTDISGQWDISRTMSALLHSSLYGNMNPVRQWSTMNPHY